jgi:hypothetical protein
MCFYDSHNERACLQITSNGCSFSCTKTVVSVEGIELVFLEFRQMSVFKVLGTATLTVILNTIALSIITLVEQLLTSEAHH